MLPPGRGYRGSALRLARRTCCPAWPRRASASSRSARAARLASAARARASAQTVVRVRLGTQLVHLSGAERSQWKVRCLFRTPGARV